MWCIIHLREGSNNKAIIDNFVFTISLVRAKGDAGFLVSYLLFCYCYSWPLDLWHVSVKSLWHRGAVKMQKVCPSWAHAASDYISDDYSRLIISGPALIGLSWSFSVLDKHFLHLSSSSSALHRRLRLGSAWRGLKEVLIYNNEEEEEESVIIAVTQCA